MEQKVNYFGWEIDLDISSENLKVMVEEISIEKKMPDTEVERELKELLAVKKNQLEQLEKRGRRLRRRYEGVSYIL